MPIVKRLWQGEVRLRTVYWGFAVLPGVLLNAVVPEVKYAYADIFRTFGSTPIFIFLAAPYVYFPFIYVAVWRSADRYVGPKHWATLAKVAVVIGAFLLLMSASIIYQGPFVSTEASLKDVAAAANKSLPKIVDQVTRLEQVLADGKRLTYHYRILGVSSSSSAATTLIYGRRKSLVTRVCSDSSFTPIFLGGADVVYEYSAMDNTPIGKIMVTAADCR